MTGLRGSSPAGLYVRVSIAVVCMVLNTKLLTTARAADSQRQVTPDGESIYIPLAWESCSQDHANPVQDVSKGRYMVISELAR